MKIVQSANTFVADQSNDMNKRINFNNLNPAFIAGMQTLDRAVAESGIDPWYGELIKLRASYLNGCAYCVDKHTQDALKLGVSARKIAVLPAWREALSHFSNEECLILLLTEEVSMIHKVGISAEVYAQCIQNFGEKMTGNLIAAAILINAWNRIGISLKMEPIF
jgi:AhpD family alkylhydroperoxidase